MNNKLMKIGMAIGVAVLLCGAASPAAFGYSQNLTNNGVVWNYGYEGDTYPTNEFFAGSKWLHDAQGANSTISFTAGGIVNDMSSGNDGMGFRLSGGGTALPSTNVWTVEFRMRLLTANSAYQGGVDFRQGSFGAAFIVRAHPTTVELRAPSAVSTAYPIGTDWHTYRVTLVGTTSTLYMDTNNAAILTMSGAGGGGDSIEFGDFGGLINAGSVELDYLRWTYGQAIGGAPIPEPTAATLLILGGCATLLGRRTKQ